ncbi:hypothetical protein K493DRAFT_388772 [Basidiobolus meristosporus CBS 931.73]|uniref:BAG domain-containing protein n=1 Tax=Basidiobolus meristosporus CBS 931.73 TaxID=1314790 RepID=A0A1Y1X9A1_9FUNG|nr:hypothetical protein K493DRAFT_388772 [Basidiobolus meristosporus CBS 931.73]|eukprot:ORX82317.1 hypothetical protein K493DRAFT_388772 [Basidiobolus meristosporus CBS 931.73]
MYSPLFGLNPMDAFRHYPVQRRIRQQPVWYYQQRQPEEYYAPQYRVIHPCAYEYHLPHPQYYRPKRTEQYYVLPSRRFGEPDPEFSGPYSHPVFIESQGMHQPYDFGVSRSDDELSSESEQEDLDFMDSAFPSAVHTPRRTLQARQQPRIDQRSNDYILSQPSHRTPSRTVARHMHQTQDNSQLIAILKQRVTITEFQRKRAARLIQRQWRLHRQKRREEAARTIVQFIRSQLNIRKAQLILQRLRQLRNYENEVNLTYTYHAFNVFNNPLKFDAESTPESMKLLPVKENRSYLGYEDALLKLLIRIDEIDSMDSEIVRCTRKSLVNKAQSLLDQLDEFKKTQYDQLMTNQC